MDQYRSVQESAAAAASQLRAGLRPQLLVSDGKQLPTGSLIAVARLTQKVSK